ncbi:MAG TPA: TRAP transporter large permease, partial [Clostridia bacterium]|nr:TRAP transporter large permease [Clostridia bacterium]
MYSSTNTFTLAAIPFFMLAGALMEVGGLSSRLVRFAMSIVGTLNGALAHVQILASCFFAAVSGSAPATAAAIGSALIPEMEREGYPREFSAAVQSVAGTIGTIIPPSIPMVIYAVATGSSIGKIFLAGIIPGIVYALSLMVVVAYQSKKHGYKSNRVFSWEEVWLSFKDAIWALLVPAIILGGIYSGVFTPTEAGVVAAVYGLIAGTFIYKELNFKKIVKVFADSSINTAMVLLIIAASSAFSWLLSRTGAARELGLWFTGITDNTYIFIGLALLLFFIAGTALETISAILILTPIIFPIAQQLGIDPIHLGIIVTMTQSHGMATPPLGECINISASIAGCSFDATVSRIWPFLLAGAIACALVAFVPQLAMFLPNLLYK